MPDFCLYDQVAADGAPYFWAGGRLSGNKRSLTWENGRSESISRGRHPWSFTGSRGAQPDGQGSEDCLAILNNFYNVSRDTETFTKNSNLLCPCRITVIYLLHNKILHNHCS